MTSISLLVVIVSLVALLVVGTEHIGSGHMVFGNRDISEHVAFTNRGINVQRDTTQDQGCESAGGTSGTTNACSATSGPGSTQTQVNFSCTAVQHRPTLILFSCLDDISFSSASCTSDPLGGASFNCTTNTGVQLTSCTQVAPFALLFFTCTRSEPGTGTTSSGGVSG